MNLKAPGVLALAVWLAALAAVPAGGEEVHHATQLGFPSTRFAPPVNKPEEVRNLFRQIRLRPDFAMVLHRWGWEGDLDDFFRAGLNADIVPWEIPVGGKMPFMCTREHGVPIVLRNVIWEGKYPVPAYAFVFVSKGRRYRCVVPRPCSNFFVEDLGDAVAKLELSKTAPAEAGLCDPFPMTVTVRNTGTLPATQVRITDALPAGLTTADHQTSVSWDAGALQPGESREFTLQLAAAATGTYVNRARAVCAEGVSAEAEATTAVKAPALALDCSAPAKMVAGRGFKACLTLRNTGDWTEPKAAVVLQVPSDAAVSHITGGGVLSDGRITWETAGLAPGAAREFCATLTGNALETLAFSAQATGSCAKPAETRCSTLIVGVSAVLLELTDAEDPVLVGEVVNYDIRVVNQGFGPLTHVKLVCRPAASQGFVSATGTSPGVFQDGLLTMDTIPSLEPKATARWRVVVKALKEDDARFKVELQADQYENPIHEDESTRQY